MGNPDDLHETDAMTGGTPGKYARELAAALATKAREVPRRVPDLISGRGREAWPAEALALPFSGHGWLADENKRVLSQFLSEDTKLIVEIGTWLGASARFMLDQAPNAALIAIDHWNGIPAWPQWKEIAPDPYLQFARDCWHYKHRLMPVRADAWDGIEGLAKLIAPPDLVYIDGDHSYDRVLGDIERVRAAWPLAVIVGDDLDWIGVRHAVDAVFDAPVNVDGRCWWFVP